jgi:hypothetical protein
MKLGAIAMAAAILALAGCGGSGSGDESTRAATGPAVTERAGNARVEGRLPSGAVEPADTDEEASEGPAATEASPEAEANGPHPTGDLPDTDRSAVTAAVGEYIEALDIHDAASVCRLIERGGVPPSDLPKRRGGCPSSLRVSIGSPPADGRPAWRRSAIAEMKPEALGDDRARVTTTVVHHFSDRSYVSVEDDVIYLERVAGRWLLAKPSATFYRAVGYGEPPLRAFSPPPTW